jgi:hypothetical protein
MGRLRRPLVVIAHRRTGSGLMAKRETPAVGKGEAGPEKSKRGGWLLIAAIALATGLFFILGTLDADVRYDLIGI